MIMQAYFFLKRVYEHVAYSLAGPCRKKIIVLTFDDGVDSESVEVARYLHSRGIRATFFLTLAQTKAPVIRELVRLSHEIGGHSVDHSSEERAGRYTSAKKCMDILAGYSKDVKSWRFPWTSKDRDCIENVHKAGFVVDSSIGVFYPLKKLQKLGPLYEMPWIRLPKSWQMDVNEPDYSSVKSYMISIVGKRSGVFVFGLHTNHQYKNFRQFKDLITRLAEEDVEFMTLQEAFAALKISVK